MSYNNSDSPPARVTSSIRLSFVQLAKLDFLPRPTRVIQIYSAYNNFDADPSDGIEAGHLDLTGILIHEIIHLLGFNSSADALIPTVSTPTMWDVFRFNASNSIVS